LLSLDNKSFDSDRSEKEENEELKGFNVEGAQEAGNQG